MEKIKTSINQYHKYREIKNKVEQLEVLGYAENFEKLPTYHNRLYIPNMSILKQMMLD